MIVCIDMSIFMRYIMGRTVYYGDFEWDEDKERINGLKHHLDFRTACLVFLDPERHIENDEKHYIFEIRYICTGMIPTGVVTVRYTVRGSAIRIFGAGYWRKGVKKYEKETKNRY